MALTDFSHASLIEMFEYLDRLRSSAVTNMFGAAPYLADAHDIDRDDARAVLKAWMHQPLSEPTRNRVDAALAEALS